MGGEKSLSVSSVWSRTGSPPHGRGKVKILHACSKGVGITPAWAGKSGIPALASGITWDHPRMGGEKSIISIIRLLY